MNSIRINQIVKSRRSRFWEISRGMAFGRGPVVLTRIGCLFGRSFIKRQFLSILRPIEIAFLFTALLF